MQVPKIRALARGENLSDESASGETWSLCGETLSASDETLSASDETLSANDETLSANDVCGETLSVNDETGGAEILNEKRSGEAGCGAECCGPRRSCHTTGATGGHNRSASRCWGRPASSRTFSAGRS